jgi:hypothetical protein
MPYEAPEMLFGAIPGRSDELEKLKVEDYHRRQDMNESCLYGH